MEQTENTTQQTGETAQQAQAAQAAPNVNFDNTIDKVTVKFNFRKVVTKDEKSGVEVESKRPTVELDLPLMSVEGIVKEFNAGGKRLDLLIEAIRDYQINRAREIVNEREDINAANFPYEELSWEAIANLPKAERRGGGIAKETWEDFSKDYIAVMPGVTGKSIEQVTNAAKILLNKFQLVKTNKPVLKLLKDQVAMYANSSPNAEQFEDCIKFLAEKAETFINLDDKALLANL